MRLSLAAGLELTLKARCWRRRCLLLQIYLRPVNPADIFSIMGVYPGFQPKSLPAVPGLEGVRLLVC